MITAATCQSRIAALEVRAAFLRLFVEQQGQITSNPAADDYEICSDSDTEEMKELHLTEEEQGRWSTDMAFLEIYEQQSAAVKDDDDVMEVWWNLRRSFMGARQEDQRAVNRHTLKEAALRAIKSPKIEVRAFMRALVYAQNRSPLNYRLLPREFMHAVVAEGLMADNTQ